MFFDSTFARPELTSANVLKFAEACADTIEAIPEDAREARLAKVAKLFAGSFYLVDVAFRFPECHGFLLGVAESPDVGSLIARDSLRGLSIPDAQRSLRKFRALEYLRIGMLDLAEERELEVVATGISEVADRVVEAAFDLALEKIRSQFGACRDSAGNEVTASVLALGKLGGSELNYSSDVDLVFVHSSHGFAEKDDGGRIRKIDAERYFARVVELFVKVVSEVTEDGFCFRVDTRLRPGGNQGAASCALAPALSYFFDSGATWERQAYLKCRCVAGDLELGAKFLSGIEKFVYRKYLTLGEIQEIKSLKLRMERQSERESPNSFEFKAGTGGIRDIEYVVQFLQLFLGGKTPEIRSRSTLEGLGKLCALGFVSEEEARILGESYRFLRKAEHRVMLVHLHKAHHMPKDRTEQIALARRMGYRQNEDEAALAAFLRDLEKHREGARGIHLRKFANLFPDDRDAPDRIAALLLDPDITEEEAAKLLAPYGVKDPRAAMTNLRSIATQRGLFAYTNARTEGLLVSLLPSLFRRLAETPDPDRGLSNFERITMSCGAKMTFFELMSENPDTLELFLDISSWSQFLADILTSFPGLIDEFVDLLMTRSQAQRRDMRAELRARMEFAPEAKFAFYDYKNLETLYIGARDISRKSNVRNTLTELSNLATGVLAESIEFVSRQLGADPAELELVVLALGKFGGRELSYASDLDLMFLHGPGSPDEESSASEFYTRLMKLVLAHLSEQTEHGFLYKVDARLRPMGGHNPLAVSIPYFENYFAEQGAELWEKLALSRAFVVYGPPSLSKRVDEFIDDTLKATRIDAGALAEIRAMRIRLQETARGSDIKLAAGGLLDIEFLAQTLMIRGVNEGAIARRLTNTIDTLDALGDSMLLSKEHFDHLRTAYGFLRFLELRMQIVARAEWKSIPEDEIEGAQLAKRLGYQDTDEGTAFALLVEECRYVMSKTRKVFDAHFPRSE
ncbi:MAG: bifunctional [glutamate--ammonia ligase]-adenylyl-L-tyrosine phosphorylase/[glutamate--ammonia-ligase] adenylyltransferase [Planctomycetes bacterium]|nr:bifunctional [glutamate--ammonia ligase]-adenylyl-L-tyrosine phosphorylase/[glutamate--ammonia-ligase] adenylyltransferase [Planctomycetota bacterium]